MGIHTRGLIARADEGGLGHLTHALARHVMFDRIAVVEMPDPRGPQDWSKYHGLAKAVQRFPYGARGLVDWITTTDVVYTAEVPYHDDLFRVAADRGCRTVLHVMPELHRADEYAGATEWWWPTSWMCPDGGRIVPVPIVIPDEWRPRSTARHFGVIGSPAMADRNGVELVMASLRNVHRSITLHVFHAEQYRFGRPMWPSNVHVQFHAPTATPDAMYDTMDVLIAPRRFGGLSMLANEAAAAGVPTIHLDRDPDRLFPGWSVPVSNRQPHRMAGGQIEVCGATPIHLARVVDSIAGEPIETMSIAARRWAEVFGWNAWADRYERLLDAY